MGSGKLLKSAIAKYGIENFVKDILHVFDDENSMNSKEREIVTEAFCLRNDTYNLCVGGQGGFSYINRNGLSVNNFENEIVARSARLLANPARSELFKNNPHLESEWKKNISKSNKGKPGTFNGKTHNAAAKEKIRNAQVGKHVGLLNNNYGKCWIKNVNNRTYAMIQRTELEYWQSFGWELGKFQNNATVVKLTKTE
jgi:hypothetical protein